MDDATLLWVDKYRPRSLKAVIGQQGDQSCANKLLRWLRNWNRHHSGGSSKPAGSRRFRVMTKSWIQEPRVLNGVCFVRFVAAQLRGLGSREEGKMMEQHSKRLCSLDLRAWGRPPQQL